MILCFFKQKTAYEMRISDWSSDVCSSDLARFKDMLARGLRLLEEETARLGASQALPGEVAFKLYDTYGFPLDLTQDILRGQGRGADTAGFDAAMARQRAAADRKSVV